MPEPLGTQDARQSFKAAWSAIDQAEDPDYFVRFMDLTSPGECPGDPQHYRRIFDLLEVRQGQRQLAVGCGRGGVVQALAKVVGATGRAVGVDISETMLAEARRRAAGVDLPIEYHRADAHHLPFDDTFDGCCSVGMWEIIDDPRQALLEMVRVAKPGARIVNRAFDWGTIAIDTTDRIVTRKLLDYYCDQETNGWIGRQLPGLYKELGLVDISVVPQVGVITDYTLLRQAFESMGWIERAQAAGVVSAAEVAAWWADLERRAAAGRFFYAQADFAVAGRKP